MCQYGAVCAVIVAAILARAGWRAQGGARRVARASARGMRGHLVVEKLAEAPPDDEVEFGFRVVENACPKK